MQKEGEEETRGYERGREEREGHEEGWTEEKEWTEERRGGKQMGRERRMEGSQEIWNVETSADK